jgi:ubiquinone/menaquinone biosynthesis C-methylase UbiE
MTFHEPSSLEILITVAAGNLFGGIYRTAVEELDLRGDERVLDFGSGAGTPARLIARKLAEAGGSLTCVDVSEAWLETARRRLNGHSNVSFLQGEIADLEVPCGSHDVVFIHFVLHDIPAGQRPVVVQHLARLLTSGGKLFIREPLGAIGQDEVRGLMQQAGLDEVQANYSRLPLVGKTYHGLFVKGETHHA